MAINLTKGANVNLSKESSKPLTKIKIGLGWDARETQGSEFDLDGSVFLLNSSDKCRSSDDFIYYGHVETTGVKHHGDNLTGIGEGDDEVISVNLTELSSDIVKLVVAVSIYSAKSRNQNFGQVSKAFIRIVNDETQEEIARYDLSEDSSMETSMIFGEVYRNGDDWKFKAVGQGYANGLEELTTKFGL